MNLRNTISIVCLLAMSSCDIYHFENPLPVDSKNSYEFPKSFQGKWYEGSEPHFTISKTSIEMLDTKAFPTKIYNGIADSVAIKKNVDGLNHIEYTKGIPTDTIQDFILIGKEIYKLEKNVPFAPGHRFKLKNDTFYLENSNFYKAVFTLGEDYFLRKVSERKYTLNLREGNTISNIIMDHSGTWYQVLWFEKTNDGKLLMGQMNKIPDSVAVYTNDGNHYLNCRWSRKQMLELTKNNLFSFTKLLKEGDKRLDSILLANKMISNKSTR